MYVDFVELPPFTTMAAPLVLVLMAWSNVNKVVTTPPTEPCRMDVCVPAISPIIPTFWPAYVDCLVLSAVIDHGLLKVPELLSSPFGAMKKLNVGDPIVYVAFPTELLASPVATPIAITVSVELTVIGDEYNVVEPVIGKVGVEPSVVKYIEEDGVEHEIVTV
jgi:hypothetical protein